MLSEDKISDEDFDEEQVKDGHSDFDFSNINDEYIEKFSQC